MGGVKIWMKLPTFFFPMSTQLAMVEKILELNWTTLLAFLPHFPLRYWMVWRSILSILPLK
jgi:hypothetical protein